MEKKIITKCPFPLVKLNIKLKYAEVHKPTGVGYIILSLIKDAKDRSENFGEVLKRFGVPNDLQFIFAKEIDELISNGILRMQRNNTYERDYFEKYSIGHFDFTENGERMFRDGAIPTGEEKSKPAVIYYNPLTFEFMYQSPYAYMSIDNSYCFPEGFMDRVEMDFTGLKDFIIENPKGIGLQQQERLLECDIASQENLFTKIENNLELNIDEDGMEVSLKTAGATDFYEKYFTPDMLEREFDAKKKFRFDVQPINVTGFDNFRNLSTAYLPEEYATLKAHPAKFMLTRQGDKLVIKHKGETVVFESGKFADATTSTISPDWSFITIDSKEMRYYTATRVTLTERTLNKPVALNLLVEQIFEVEQMTMVLKSIYDECMTMAYSVQSAHIVRTICELTNNTLFISEFVENKINNAIDIVQQSEILLSANSVFANTGNWPEVAKGYANNIYDDIIAEMTKENISNTVRMIRRLDNIRNANKRDLMFLIVDKFGHLDDIEIFNIITSADGFTENDALTYANIIKIYTDKILAEETRLAKTSLADSFEGLAHNLNDLKRNLGISSTTKYAFREGYDKGKFVEDFRAYSGKLKAVKKYEGFAKEGFDELAKYEKIMQPVFEYIMVERNASYSPEQISESYIRDKIVKGEYNRAISDMHIRLEWALSKVFNTTKEKSIELIDKAKKEKLITVETADMLHGLRKFRNKLQHPTDEQLMYDKETFMAWAEALFSININKDKGSKK